MEGQYHQVAVAGARYARAHREGSQGCAGDVGRRSSGRFALQGFSKAGFLSCRDAIEPKHTAPCHPLGASPIATKTCPLLTPAPRRLVTGLPPQGDALSPPPGEWELVSLTHRTHLETQLYQGSLTELRTLPTHLPRARRVSSHCAVSGERVAPAGSS
jgi:hypothetical protein